MPRQFEVLATPQFEKDFKNISTPSLRKKLMAELDKLVGELEKSGMPASSRVDTELSGWSDAHFAYLSKPYGLVYRIEGDQLQLVRLVPEEEVLFF